ncbi:hypothetical protein LUZ60_002860 [Juncus effusus]|nr:hypothetical protein LUZ60_002860 [Juncus effusus]
MHQSLNFRPLISLHGSRFSPRAQGPTSSKLSSPQKPASSPAQPNHRRLTARVVELTKRRQLKQIFSEVEKAKKRNNGKLNRIVMNAVMEACVRCGDVDSARKVFDEMGDPGGCGLDCVSYGILLKGLGQAKRVDEAFQIIESVQDGTAVGNPILSHRLISGLLNAILESGDMRRANALVARCRHVLYDQTNSVILFNLLMKGYVKTSSPLSALTVKDEMVRQGLRPDKLTYNTLMSACVKAGEVDRALQLLEDMKEEARSCNRTELMPDCVTYTTLLKGLASRKDADTLLKIVIEMKSSLQFIDRTAYTATIDAFLSCNSIQCALCIFGEIIKRCGNNKDLTPKPHLYLSMMRAFASFGEFDQVKRFHARMWLDSVGSVCDPTRLEAQELLMEAAVNNNQVDVAKKILGNILKNQRFFSWTSRGGLVAIKVEALTGFTNSSLKPYILPEIILDNPVEKYMIPFDEINPLRASMNVRDVTMRFFNEIAIPVTDEWGNCIGIVHRRDCVELDAPLSSIIMGPPLCVGPSNPIGRVIDLLLRKKLEMAIVMKNVDLYEGNYGSSSRPLGVFSLDRLRNVCDESEISSFCDD